MDRLLYKKVNYVRQDGQPGYWNNQGAWATTMQGFDFGPVGLPEAGVLLSMRLSPERRQEFGVRRPYILPALLLQPAHVAGAGGIRRVLLG